MADTKISALTDGGNIDTNDVIPVVRAGANRKVAYAGTLTATMPFVGAARHLAATSGSFNPTGFQVLNETYLDTSDYDDDGAAGTWWSNADDGFVVPSGVTKVRYTVNVSTNNDSAGADTRLRLKLNGTIVAADQDRGNGSNNPAKSVSVDLAVSASDILTADIYSSDSSVTLLGDQTNASVQALDGSALDISITL